MFWLKIPSRGSKKPPRGFKGGKLLPQLYFYNTDPKGADGTGEKGQWGREKSGEQTHGVSSVTYKRGQPGMGSQKLTMLKALERHHTSPSLSAALQAAVVAV